jgi:hypothetical protein
MRPRSAIVSFEIVSENSFERPMELYLAGLDFVLGSRLG